MASYGRQIKRAKYKMKQMSSTVGISLVPYAATDVIIKDLTSQTINTRLQVISGMDQFKLYSLEELRYFDGRLMETTAVVGPNTIGKNQQFIYPQGTEEEEVLGEKQTLTTKHMCITAIKKYEDFSLEELRYADGVVQQLFKHERHNYLKKESTQTDTSGWPYPVKELPFGFIGVQKHSTVSQKCVDDKTKQKQTIAEKSSDDLSRYSPKNSEITNLQECNNPGDETEHKTKNVTDASLVFSVKPAPSGLSSIATLERVASDTVLNMINSLSVEPIKDGASSSTDHNLNTIAASTLQFDRQTTTSFSGSEAVLLTSISSAECSSFQCNSLPSSDGATHISPEEPGLFSKRFATDEPFSFKCVPYFSEAMLRSPDQTFTVNTSSLANPGITQLISNPVFIPTLATCAPFSFKSVPKFSKTNFMSPDKTLTLDNSSLATTRTTSSLSNPVSIPTLATDAQFSFKCEPKFGEASLRNPDKTFTFDSSSSATTRRIQSLSNPGSTQTTVPVTSSQCQTASLDNNNAISSIAPVQVTVKETYAKKPDVLELFVGGTHRYTTLLSTMTQAKAGFLADIFFGKGNVPLHVLKDGSFFLDTDGESFKLIIEYLRDGRLPDMDVASTKGTSRCVELLLKSFQTARKYGLHEYLHDLDQYVHIQRFKELEANKNIVEFYAKQILWALNKTDLEQNGKFAILLKSTKTTVISAACCKHVCQFAPVDTVVYLTRDFSLRILSLLCQRLRCLGYNVSTNEESCVFRCSTHEEGDAGRKECTSRRHLLTWFCPL
ncbi:uncharacterized protein LOC127835445 isoform X2 [Dreissena polymorpha]|uniref:uncharacterized protein LOC127835445 isoform X2 n=1 Tax=Dreissena polymorpha TaxID=45954 RepID=UPI002264106F|nr:uncharacterized protein LOC127835445 isoform X2 [Dreissena polymorpha]XP_052217841.1 uncharacterized protein LOC127835445 isoform X2 [Dreissena polymorpha]